MRKDKKCPWSIRAEKIEHDNPKKTIYYHNAVMKIYDFPWIDQVPEVYN